MNRYELQNLTLDTHHVAKHLPNTPESQRLIRTQGMAHLFTDEATMLKVIVTIQQQGEYLGQIRGHIRWGYLFDQPIGYRLADTGEIITLYYGEIKISGGKYHVIPRTKPSP
jgi:hypothetical protein